MSPEIVLPDFATELETSTPMYSGTLAGGAELLPGLVVHGPAHAAGGVLVGSATVAAKPLNAAGAVPPDRLFCVHQSSAHHVTVLSGSAQNLRETLAV